MTLADDDVVEIVRASGREPLAIAALPDGVSCHAWRCATARGDVVVRAARSDRPAAEADAPRFEAQAAILERLRPLDPHLPEPIATNRSAGDRDPLGGRVAWSVDAAVPGAPLPRGAAEAELPKQATRELGALLARLHTLQCSGFGMLADRRDVLHGAAQDFDEGMLARYHDAWPYSGAPLVSHPVARVAPQTIGALSQLRDQLMRYGSAGRLAVLHGDLHEGHVFVETDHLGALIDFGSAWIGPPGADLASFAAFYGWPLTTVLLEGYEANGVMRDVRLAEAHQLAVVVALHRIRRSLDERDGRQDRWLRFLQEALPLATRRDA